MDVQGQVAGIWQCQLEADSQKEPFVTAANRVSKASCNGSDSPFRLALFGQLYRAEQQQSWKLCEISSGGTGAHPHPQAPVFEPLPPAPFTRAPDIPRHSSLLPSSPPTPLPPDRDRSTSEGAPTLHIANLHYRVPDTPSPAVALFAPAWLT